MDISQLDPELRNKVYQPGPEERYNVELDKAKVDSGYVQVPDEVIEPNQ